MREYKARTLCAPDAPLPRAIVATIAVNKLPIDEITPVGGLDPYFYQ
jgi:hypothetical protein